MSKFQLRCSCIKCKIETTTGQLTRNHSGNCPVLKQIKSTTAIGRGAWNKGLVGDLRCSRIGKPGTLHTDETKKRLSVVAKERGFGGYRENAGHSKKFKVVDSFNKETVLQSTYELECFGVLTELGINWLRPKALKYDGRNYFADFYLTDYDIWLDPKNDYKAKQDKEKIEKVIAQNNVRLFVLLKDQITKEYIQHLCS